MQIHSFQKNRVLFFFLLFTASLVTAQPVVTLEPFASGLSIPVEITNAGDDRLFVVEKVGRIKIIDTAGNVLPTPFLDITNRVNARANERGLLGLAFHPDYVQNGYFFVNYTKSDGSSVVARFSRSTDNPDVADPNSEKKILEVRQPNSNHNGGDLVFGPDSLLYIALGDGGGAGDQNNYAQTRTTMLGKLLRIDINTDSSTAYAIPEDNPFAMDDFTLDEIWALGLRNPWRISFDRQTGDLWIADVGQGDREEINLQLASSQGGENYGWRCYEGDRSFNTSDCPSPENFVAPTYVYNHSNSNCGGSITGGYVYRGKKFADIAGLYIYADYCTGIVDALVPQANGTWENVHLLDYAEGRITTFGEDFQGELYVADVQTGEVLKLEGSVINSTKNSLQLDQFRLYPNPFREELQVQFETPVSGNYRFRLYDLQGRTVWQQKEEIYRSFSKSFDLQQLRPGAYFLEIVNGASSGQWKLIKK